MPHHPSHTYIFSQGKSKVNQIYRCRSCVTQLGSGERQRHKDNTVSQTSVLFPLCIQLQLHLTWDLFHQHFLNHLKSFRLPWTYGVSPPTLCMTNTQNHEQMNDWMTNEWNTDLSQPDPVLLWPTAWPWSPFPGDMFFGTPASSLNIPRSLTPPCHCIGHSLPTLLSLTS